MKSKKVFAIITFMMVLFMAGCKKDDEPRIAPKVNSTIPANAALSAATSSNITAKFSTKMDPLTITGLSFTLKKGTVSIPGVITYSDSTATLNPADNMLPNTLYTATITAAVKDVLGTTMLKDFTWTFTTGDLPDITAPTLTLSDPLNNATGVAINKLIAVTFSETMNPVTITSLTYTLKQGTVTVPGVVSYSGLKATFTPTANLDYSKVYTGSVTTGVKDVAGNALAAVYTFSFTTVAAPDVTAPTVVSTNPLDNAINVSFSNTVVLTFSELMDPLTITANTFTLKQGTTAVPGTVIYSGTTATFTPANALAASTVYSAALTTAAKDLAGNALAANKAWSFTTKGPSAGQAVVNLGTSANYVILAKTAINNIPTSAITGDLGLSPAATSYITGFGLTDATGYATSPQVTGKVFAADMVTPT
jgi:methionine-rich copper-binding protein CopC